MALTLADVRAARERIARAKLSARQLATHARYDLFVERLCILRVEA